MEITDIRIKKRDGDGRLKAIVSVTFDNEFVIHDVKIIEGNNGTDFIAMPSRKTPDGEYKDIAHPIHSQAREKLERAIFEKYAEVKAASPAPTPVYAESVDSEEAAEDSAEVQEELYSEPDSPVEVEAELEAPVEDEA